MSELRVLVAAPTRRDGEVTGELLSRAAIDCVVCREFGALAGEVESGVGAIVLTDTALVDPELNLVLQALRRQPAWSDIPVLLMTVSRSSSSNPVRLDRALSNVTILDLPSSARSMVSAVQSALRGRQRQYQIRDQLVARERAEEALRAAHVRKDEFLATLAHELRNPLAAVRMGIQVAVRHPADAARMERIVGMIDRQSRLLVRLIDDLMDVSRISTGKLLLDLKRFDLRSVIETVLEAGQTIPDASGRAVRLALSDAPVWVLGDAARLAQVVGNLVNNACKYTPDGGRITVALSQEGSEAVIRVIDTGVGIPEDSLEQVFEMFAQVDRTMERAQGGLGIGLSLVRRLVELHRGTVTAHSAGIDQGSTFVVRLPAESEMNIGIDRPPDASPCEKGRRLKVLVIDDNHDVADGLATLLEGEGHETRTTYSGATGLAEWARFRPHIVFCDIGMPGMTGHEVVRRLRAHAAGDVPLLVAITGWGNEGDRKLSAEAGFDIHLTKPVSLEQLNEIVFAASARNVDS